MNNFIVWKNSVIPKMEMFVIKFVYFLTMKMFNKAQVYGIIKPNISLLEV